MNGAASIRRLAILFACVLVGACRPTTPGSLPDPSPLEVATVRGAQVVRMPRSTPGYVHLSVWVDAGSRDADPPQVALLAAWAAAARGGEDVVARVFPDGTAFEVECEPVHVGPALEALGRALHTRGMQESERLPLVGRLANLRRQAETDSGRRADALALRSLLGEAAEAFQPLGVPAHDSRATAARIEEFLAAHYGPARTLWVAAGDTQSAGVTEHVRRALRGAWRAESTRTQRSLPTVANPEPQMAVGPGRYVAAAAPVPDSDRAALTAHVSTRAGPPHDAQRLSVHAFPVRGGAVLLARLEGDPVQSAAEYLTFSVGRALLEPVEPAISPPRGDPVADACALAMRWLADGSLRVGVRDRARPAGGETLPRPLVGLGVVAPSDLLTPLPTAHARGLQWTEVPEDQIPEPEAQASAVDLVVPNGAQVRLRRRSNDERMAVAVRLRGGSGQDRPSTHGLTALTAHAITSCVHREFAARPPSLAVGPLVEPDSFGVALEVAPERWRTALDVAVRCALFASWSDSIVEQARLALLSTLGDGDRYAGWAAQALAPEAPGAVAPRGTRSIVRDLPSSTVFRRIDTARAAARLAVGVVGPIPLSEAATRSWRNVVPLGPGDPLPATQTGQSPSHTSRGSQGRPRVLTASWEGAQPHAVAVWFAPGRPGSGLASRAFAASVAASLPEPLRDKTLWVSGGSTMAGAWAALALIAEDALLDRLPPLMQRSVGRALERRAGSSRLSRTFAKLRQVRARLRASTGWSAAELSQPDHKVGPGAAESEQVVLELAHELAKQPPTFVVGRPDLTIRPSNP